MRAAAKHTSGAWQIRRSLETTNPSYTVSRRTALGYREHLEYASTGEPMLYGLEQAQAAVVKAKETA